MIKIISYFLLFYSAVVTGYAQTSTADNMMYRANVGDIPFNSETDDSCFELSDESNALPYNTRCGMLITGEKYRVIRYFAENYTQDPVSGATGYVVIRFLVNYKGETDRFRVYEMDQDFSPGHFTDTITGRLLGLTKSITGWIPVKPKKILHVAGLPVESAVTHPDIYDYYQYIVFKIKDGLIETILP